MNWIYRCLIPGIWLAWGVAWVVSARGVRPPKRVESRASQLFRLAAAWTAFALVAAPLFPVHWLNGRLLRWTSAEYFAGAGILLAGMALAVWARIHLGQYWSAKVTLKEGHRLIRTGPYAWVRNPIYTGMFAGYCGTVLAAGVEWRGLIGLAILMTIYVVKIQTEERFLKDEFGTEFALYRREVPSLFPWRLPHSS